MTAGAVLHVVDVSKSFGAVDVLEKVSVAVEPGEVVAIVGHNGAGKTTLMRIAVGLVRPDSGEVHVGGIPLARIGNLGGLVGTSLDASALPATWRVGVAMRIAAELAGADERRIGEALALVGLAEVVRRRIGALSMGMRQRLALAVAMVARPRLLMLDEPTNALDPAVSHEVRGWLARHAARGNAILLSSHNLAEVEEIADRVVIVHKGRVVRDEVKATLLAADSTVVRVDRPDVLLDWLVRHDYAVDRLAGAAIRVDGLTADETGVICAQLGLVVRQLVGERPRLTDVYQTVTTSGVQS
ncbi:ABC transporter ATP-binding protein [Kutzneria sp. NPDC052558]|uniref:ABC transporter ATP-binding protein n=1 Tax=Kutzneria sp. NPDC052558 TaxID=3364121 RepID=UPI0037C5F274